MVQEMQLHIKAAKPPISAAGGMGGFVLVETPAPNPGEQHLFWVTIPSGSAARLKILWKSGYNIAENFGDVQKES
jgi:hypothetical protein